MDSCALSALLGFPTPGCPRYGCLRVSSTTYLGSPNTTRVYMAASKLQVVLRSGRGDGLALEDLRVDCRGYGGIMNLRKQVC